VAFWKEKFEEKKGGSKNLSFFCCWKFLKIEEQKIPEFLFSQKLFWHCLPIVLGIWCPQKMPK